MNLRTFLAARVPPPPEPLASWLAAGAGEAEPLEGLTEQALRELARAREVGGRVRAGAWHLLAADALITYACEAALEGPEPPRALEELLERVAAGGV